MIIKRWTMGTEGLTEELNKSKELFVRTMHNEGVITDQQYEVMQQHSVVIAQKGFFGSLWDKIFKKEDCGYYFVVKILTPKNSDLAIKPDEEEE